MKYGAATQWDKTEQESPQVEDEAPVGFSDLTPESQKGTVRIAMWLQRLAGSL